jgi:hypothetical protein
VLNLSFRRKVCARNSHRKTKHVWQPPYQSVCGLALVAWRSGRELDTPVVQPLAHRKQHLHRPQIYQISQRKHRPWVVKLLYYRVVGLRLATGWTVDGSELESQREQDFSPLHVVQTGSGAHPAYAIGTGGIAAGA